MCPHRILLAAGSNAKGQLGIGSCEDAHTFTPCQFAAREPNQLFNLTARVVRVACGANHTVLLLEHLDGSTTLWGTGDGGRGQLGPVYPREESKLKPEPELVLEPEPEPELEQRRAPWTVFHELGVPARTCVEDGYRCKDVGAAWETTYVVLARPGCSDVLLSMGSNEFGALGVGVGVGGASVGQGSAEPQVVDFDHVLAGVFQSSDGNGQPGSRTTCVRAVYAGPRHVVAQLVVGAGADANHDGQSSSYSRAVLVGWGASRHDQLGQNGGARFVSRPVCLSVDVDGDPVVACALGNQHTVILHESGRVSALGSNKQEQIPSFAPRTRICRLGCTWNGTYVQMVDGDGRALLSIGSNAQGQLGRGHTAGSNSAGDTAVDLPVDRALSGFVCGSEHVLAAMSGASQERDSVVGWGWNEHGNMGLGSVGNIAIPTQVWPRQDMEAYNKYPQKVVGIWAGCATSWLLVE